MYIDYLLNGHTHRKKKNVENLKLHNENILRLKNIFHIQGPWKPGHSHECRYLLSH